MATRKHKRAELQRKRLRRDELATAIAEKVAEREEIEKRIAVKEEREPVNEERREKIDADLERLRRQYRDVRKRIGELRERRKKLGRQIDRIVKWLRSHTRPKVVDLNLSFRSLSARPADNRSVGHHTAGPTDDSDAEAAALWRRYAQYHLNLGWAGLGYHVGIARSGTIFKLRPRYAYGAHAVGGNAYTGIVCHGTTGDKPTKAQARSLRWLLRHPGKVGVASLGGRLYLHRELPNNSTACPGTHARLYESRGKTR